MAAHYCHHLVECAPRSFATVADALRAADWAGTGAGLYGAWRAQIGQPRDTLNVITVSQAPVDASAVEPVLGGNSAVRNVTHEPMRPTLRPSSAAPPIRQGNYAFRWFELPQANWPEFLALCEAAWPGFEAAYDSQVVGLWQSELTRAPGARALLLTRRPDLAMWERSKQPANADEQEVRARLSRRYDLCESTWVYTTTLLGASDQQDTVRWT
ncbi:MAG: hypothetical protein AAF458_11155 [Pseudomonadota bacterium]